MISRHFAHFVVDKFGFSGGSQGPGWINHCALIGELGSAGMLGLERVGKKDQRPRAIECK